MLDALVSEGADIVIGSRFVSKKKGTSARMAGSTLISFLIKLTTGKKLLDPTSGMRMYNRRAITEFVKRSDFGPEPDTLAFLIRKGFEVIEVQAEMRERETGESYLSFSKSIVYMAVSYTHLVEKRASYEKAQSEGAFGLLRFHRRYDGFFYTVKIAARSIAKR